MRETVLRSNQSKTLIESPTGAAKITVQFGDARRGRYEGDLTAEEADKVVKDTNLEARKARGRRKAKPAPATA